MSLLKLIKQQLGISATPANNFTFDASADDGTMKLARGNAGATTQDIMTVSAAGKVAFPQQAQTTGVNGSVELPGGIIKKWGYFVNTNDLGTGFSRVTFPSPFPNACDNVIVSSLTGTPSYHLTFACVNDGSAVATGFEVVQYNNSGAALPSPGMGAIYWEAIGH